MITKETTFTPAVAPFLLPAQELTQTLYFDIETTGLSAQTSYIYLIGCAYFSEGAYWLLQWMTTEPSEEKELLRLFFEKQSSFSVLVHYNGTSFDLPFLEKKAKRHCLSCPLEKMQSVDLYKLAQKYKKLLPTENMKLKTIERFFGLPRTDTFSGGELIGVYAEFLGLYKLNTLTNGSKKKEVDSLTHVLLLHNAEDVMNLLSLTVLQAFSCLSSFFSSALDNSDNSAENRFCGKREGSVENPFSIRKENQFYICSAPVPFCFPKEVTLFLPFDAVTLALEFPKRQAVTELALVPFCGELKHFYPNVEDYYFLPAEDCAMHKSIAEFVEKQFRKKATPATCYTKHTGEFLPLQKLSSAKTSATKEADTNVSASFSCFLSDFKSNYIYTPLSPELLSDHAALASLCAVLLKSLLANP